MFLFSKPVAIRAGHYGMMSLNSPTDPFPNLPTSLGSWDPVENQESLAWE